MQLNLQSQSPQNQLQATSTGYQLATKFGRDANTARAAHSASLIGSAFQPNNFSAHYSASLARPASTSTAPTTAAVTTNLVCIKIAT